MAEKTEVFNMENAIQIDFTVCAHYLNADTRMESKTSLLPCSVSDVLVK